MFFFKKKKKTYPAEQSRAEDNGDIYLYKRKKFGGCLCFSRLGKILNQETEKKFGGFIAVVVR